MLEWMGNHRLFIKTLFYLFNIYARNYTQSYALEGTYIDVSSAQIHTLEAIMEADGKVKMSEIAADMGITRGTFSNNVKKLMDKQYIRKIHMADNQKDIFLTVTEKGLQAYDQYVQFINEGCFQHIFELWDTIPDEHQATFYQIINALSEAFKADGKKNNL